MIDDAIDQKGYDSLILAIQLAVNLQYNIYDYTINWIPLEVCMHHIT